MYPIRGDIESKIVAIADAMIEPIERAAESPEKVYVEAIGEVKVKIPKPDTTAEINLDEFIRSLMAVGAQAVGLPKVSPSDYGIRVFDVGFGETVRVNGLTVEEAEAIKSVLMSYVRWFLDKGLHDYAVKLVMELPIFLLGGMMAKQVLNAGISPKIKGSEQKLAVEALTPRFIKYGKDVPSDYVPNSYLVNFSQVTVNGKAVEGAYQAYILGANVNGKDVFWKPSENFVVVLATDHLIGVAEPLNVWAWRIVSGAAYDAIAETPRQVVGVSIDNYGQLYPVYGLPAMIVTPQVSKGVIEVLAISETNVTPPVQKKIQPIGLVFTRREEVADIASMFVV